MSTFGQGSQDWLKTVRYGKIMKRATFRSGWTKPGKRVRARAKVVGIDHPKE